MNAPPTSNLFEELRAEVGDPLGYADFLPQGQAVVQAFHVRYQDKRFVVGKCLGAQRDGQLVISQLGHAVVRRMQIEDPFANMHVMPIPSRDRTRQICEATFNLLGSGSHILFVTEDERILAQLLWLMGVGMGRTYMGIPMRRGPVQ